MSACFLTDIQWLNFSDYPGHVIRGRFSVAEYHDSLFSHFAIPFPAHLSAAVAKRRAEYLAGRCLARQALAQLDHHGVTVTTGDHRAPVWPPGVAGALSHNVDTVLCAVQREHGLGGVGLDVETLMTQQRAVQLWQAIVSTQEHAWLQRQPIAFPHLLTLVFSAKESLFKALYPQVQRYFDFLDARTVAVDWQAQTLELELLTTLTPHCPAGRRFSGRFLLENDSVTTFIHL
ncbi:TPA: 4'-phosphopantetheinyl transferase superfamily protein [Serratia odorifera]|nr:4'-phosphopantetheinyl transferase superfamily protein [Serratia odorifera]